MKKVLYIVAIIGGFLGLAFFNKKFNWNFGDKCANFVQKNADRMMSLFDKSEQKTENTSSEEAAGETAS